MKTQDELEQLGLGRLTLSQFTGTSAYYRISRRHLLTDGTKYLAEKGECFWMMDAVASHLCEIGTQDWFVLIRVQVSEGRALSPASPGKNALQGFFECRAGASCKGALPYTDFGGMQSPHMNMRRLISIRNMPMDLGLCKPHLWQLLVATPPLFFVI